MELRKPPFEEESHHLQETRLVSGEGSGSPKSQLGHLRASYACQKRFMHATFSIDRGCLRTPKNVSAQRPTPNFLGSAWLPKMSHMLKARYGTKWWSPRTMLQEVERRNSATTSGWDCPFIYPGFDCGSNGQPINTSHRLDKK